MLKVSCFPFKVRILSESVGILIIGLQLRDCFRHPSLLLTYELCDTTCVGRGRRYSNVDVEEEERAVEESEIRIREYDAAKINLALKWTLPFAK